MALQLLARYTVDKASPNQITKDQANKSVKVIMNVPQPYYNHYGGRIAFGPDGMLYIGRGDGGWEGDPLNAGQRLDTLLGKMLRINVDTPDDVAYSIPKDNPFARADYPQMMSLFGITEEGFSKIKIGARPEIWAYGLRNPYMFHFDLEVGRSVHCRCRPKPLGGDQLSAALIQGRRELRLEAQHGHQMPSDDRAERQVPDRRCVAGRRVSRTRSPIRAPPS